MYVCIRRSAVYGDTNLEAFGREAGLLRLCDRPCAAHGEGVPAASRRAAAWRRPRRGASFAPRAPGLASLH